MKRQNIFESSLSPIVCLVFEVRTFLSRQMILWQKAGEHPRGSPRQLGLCQDVLLEIGWQTCPLEPPESMRQRNFSPDTAELLIPEDQVTVFSRIDEISEWHRFESWFMFTMKWLCSTRRSWMERNSSPPRKWNHYHSVYISSKFPSSLCSWWIS